MVEFTTLTLADAHEAAFDIIMEQHKEIDIQTHVDKKEFTLEFEGPGGSDDIMVMHILEPLAEPQISPGCKYSRMPGFVDGYKKQFLTLTPPRADGKEATYTYWNRLKDYPSRIFEGREMILIEGDGRGDGFDQVTPLIEKLKGDHNNRRGVMIPWNPMFDATSRDPPCLNWVQVIIRNGRMHMRILFRSQDMLLGLPGNLVGCAAMMASLAGEIGVPAGSLTLISTTPHIYKKRDGDEFDMMRNHIFRRKMVSKSDFKDSWPVNNK